MPQRAARYLNARAANRPNATDRGYNAHWRRTRAAFLQANPLCVHCLAADKVTEATVADHLDDNGPHGPRGHDHGNLQALCKPCHDRKTAKNMHAARGGG